jgi:hypothetical protein
MFMFTAQVHSPNLELQGDIWERSSWEDLCNLIYVCVTIVFAEKCLYVIY